MAHISTLSGVSETSDNFFEVTSVVDIGSGVDDIADATFLMKDGGLLRWRNGCSTTFTRCTFIESETAQGLGADNFDTNTDNFASNTGQARWYGTTCSPIFKGCQWQQTTQSRSDFDVSNRSGNKASPSFLKDEYGNYCKVTMRLPSGYTYAQFNHFASDTITIDGLVIDHQISAAGAFEFANIPADVDQMKDIVIVDNDEGNAARHVVLLGYNVPNGGDRTIKGLGCRNIALFGGGFDYSLRLVDPVGTVRKASDASQSNDGRLQAFRTYSGNFIDAADQTDVEARTIYYTRTDSSDIHLDNTDTSFSVELMEYQEDWDSNVLDQSMNDYTEKLVAYGYNTQESDFTIASTTDPLKYAKGSVLMFSNPDVTASKATAEAMTTVASATDIYDALHYYSVTRPDDVDYVGTMPVSVSGTELDFGATDVVIDPTLDLPYAAVNNPTGQTHPAGASGTYIIDLVVNNGATPNIESTVTFTDLNAESNYDSSTAWRLGNFVFKDDGTKAYVHAFRSDDDRANIVLQYSLSTAYDLSTKTLEGSFEDDINGQSGFLSFKPDGTRMYLSKRWGTHYQVDLPTAWDVSSITGGWTSKTMNSRECGHGWNSDGTKYYTIDDSRSNYSNRIKEYTPSTAWDITTITQWQSTTYDFGQDGWSRSADNDRWMNTFQFVDGGNYIVIFNAPSNRLWRYKLTSPFTLTGLTLDADDTQVLGAPADEVYSPFVDVTTGKLYYVEPRDQGFDGDQSFDVSSVPASLPKGYAGTANTAYIKASSIAANGGIDTLRTTGTVTLSNGATTALKVIDSTGVSLNVDVSGVVDGSRIQIYNVTQDSELQNTTVSGTSHSFAYQSGVANAVIDTDDQIRIRLTYQSGTSAKLPFETTAIATDGGVTAIASQKDDEVYNANAIDGSTVAEFTKDEPNVQIDANDNDGATTVQRIYAWYVNYLTTEAGIRNANGGVKAVDEVNYEVDPTLYDMHIQNINSTPLFVTGGRIYRKDDTTILEAGTGPVQIEYGRVYAIETSGGGGASNAPTAAQIRAEIDSNSTQLASIRTTVEAIPTHTPIDYTNKLDDIKGVVDSLPTTMPDYATELASIQSRVDTNATANDYLEELRIINEGIKKTGLAIPHTRDFD